MGLDGWILLSTCTCISLLFSSLIHPLSIVNSSEWKKMGVMVMSSSLSTTTQVRLPSQRVHNICSLSFRSSFPTTLTLTTLTPPSPTYNNNNNGRGGGCSFIQAAWTRRSRGEAAKKPNKKSWKQRTDMYMRPFLLNVFFSKRFVHAKVMHRGTSKVISVATTNAKDLRNSLPSLTDNNACRLIGKLIAERSKEADVYALAYEPRKDERIEGKLGIILDTIKENGILFV